MSAQADRALFLYGFDITQNNQFLNFTSPSGGPFTATIPLGNYTCSELLSTLAQQMILSDPAYTYTVSITRGVPSLEQNMITIATNGSYVNILFGTGDNAGNSVASLLGFLQSDYTGHATYNSSNSAGQALFPDYPIYDYISPDNLIMNDMSKSVSAAGIKETLVYAQMKFLKGSWKYINNFNGNTQLTQWQTFMQYAIRQLKFEFTPSVYEDVTNFYKVTLETTPADSNGGGYEMQLMNKDGYFRFYETGNLKFRVVPDVS